jgi:outer membrane protein
VELAQRYVNFLRGTDMQASLPIVTPSATEITALQDVFSARVPGGTTQLGPLQQHALTARPELFQLMEAVNASKAGVQAARAESHPALVFALDAGSQGEKYKFGSGYNFASASLVLNWNLWDSGTRRAKQSKARATVSELEFKALDLQRSLQLEVERAWREWNLQQASIVTAKKRVLAAEGAFRIASKKRDLGAINQTEFLDATRALTDARLSVNVATYASLDRLVELEYAVGSYPFLSLKPVQR